MKKLLKDGRKPEDVLGMRVIVNPKAGERACYLDRLAVGGTAAYSLYKDGLTDPEEVKHLKTIMLAAAELAALRLKDFPTSKNHKGIEMDQRDGVFRVLDKNGKISIEELTEVMEELGAPGKDAREMMQPLDSNSDGSSSDEFHMFQEQVELVYNLEARDDQCKKLLDEKLHMADESGLIQIYNEFGNRLAS